MAADPELVAVLEAGDSARARAAAERLIAHMCFDMDFALGIGNQGQPSVQLALSGQAVTHLGADGEVPLGIQSASPHIAANSAAGKY